MEKETSGMLTLAATLLLVSAVLSIVMFTVWIGQTIRADFIESATDTQNLLSTGQLRSLAGRDPVVMPKATAYVLLTQDSKGVKSLTIDGRPSTSEFPSDDLAKDLTGRVTMEVIESDPGYYDIIITEINID